MGFWQTGYLEHHEQTGYQNELTSYEPPPPVFRCETCDMEFEKHDELRTHIFAGHNSKRPQLFLQGRECGRSRKFVIEGTRASDWEVRNAIEVFINGKAVLLGDVGRVLCAEHFGVTTVLLRGESTGQDFEFEFTVAEESDLNTVDAQLLELMRGRVLSMASIDRFLENTNTAKSANLYRSGFANYFYGVLAREGSPESGLTNSPDDVPAYMKKYDQAVSHLTLFNRAPAEAVCGLVAFHYNQFEISRKKTRSPRVAWVSQRLGSLVEGKTISNRDAIPTFGSSDMSFSDRETERVLTWCCIPLDGSANAEVDKIEGAISNCRPADQLKLHIISAEHHLKNNDLSKVLSHVSVIRHNTALQGWIDSVQNRTEKKIS